MLPAVVVALGATSTLRADLTAETWSTSVAPSSVATGDVGPSRASSSLVDLDSPAWLLVDRDATAPVETSQPTPAHIAGRTAEVSKLPAGPGSASLFLCALGTFGAWHLTRSAARVDLGAAPEWFHTGGPGQIGYAVPIDLGFAAVAVSPDLEGSDEPPACDWTVCERDDTCQSQWYTSVVAPRGPPALS